MERRPTHDEIEQFLKTHGRRGIATLSTLGKLQPFVECMESELGQALLGGLILRHEELLNKISELNATDEDKMEFKVTKRILIDLSTQIAEYNRKLKVIKGG
jgi:hypothetical protein